MPTICCKRVVFFHLRIGTSFDSPRFRTNAHYLSIPYRFYFYCKDSVSAAHAFLPAVKLPQASRILPEIYYLRTKNFRFQRTRSKIQRPPPQRSASSSEPIRPPAILSFHCSSRLFFLSLFHLSFFLSFSFSPSLSSSYPFLLLD